MQLFHNLHARARRRAGTAPTVARAVIRTNAREFRDFCLYGIPSDRGNTEPAIQNNRRTSLSPAIDAQTQVVKRRTKRNGFALLRKSARVRPVSKRLVARAHNCSRNDEHKKTK